jgi:hypothetical protein
MDNAIPNKQLRSFGLLVGGIFGLIGLWPMMVRGEDPRWWSLVIGVLLVIPAVLAPIVLTRPYKAWMQIGHLLGWINTRIILGLIFYAIVTPIGIVRRWLGKDPMGRQFRPDLDSYRIPRTSRPASHLKKQY